MAEARLRSVRARTTLGATVVVGVALALAAAGMLLALRSRLEAEVRDAARQRGRDVAAALGAGQVPTLGRDDGSGSLVQVLDADGVVVAASESVRGAPAVAELDPGGTERRGVLLRDLDDEPDPGADDADDPDELEEQRVLVVAVAATTPDGPRTVLAGRGLHEVDEAVEAAGFLLLVGLPVVLALVAGTTWVVVGRALAPVEAMRAEVEAIGGSDLHRRVVVSGRDEIGRLGATMNRMLGRLEGAQLRQRGFVSDASHELRSPVAAIRQHAEVALAHPERTTVPALAQAVLAEDLRVQALVDDLLLLARADEGALRRTPVPVDVDDLVLEEARRLRATTRLAVGTGGVSAGRVEGDAGALRRVLRNLADNAARHATSRVDLAVHEHGGRVVLLVDDDGPGIPEAERQRVLERFVRLDDARGRRAGGAGLGLAIVAAVVGAHGGEVRFEASPLGGARAVVELPAAPDA